MKKRSLLAIAFLFSFSIVGFAQATYKNVAAIFLNKCANCHREGDAAPFPLISYNDIAKRASFIKKVITENYMPPWQADAHYRDFANNRLLSTKEKETILQWINAGAPKGDFEKEGIKALLLAKTIYNRKPDTTLKISKPFLVKGDNTERFLVFKVPFQLSAAHNIEAVELYTNNKKIIHHINYGFYEVADTSVDISHEPFFINSIDDTDRRKSDPYAQINKQMVYYTGWIPGTSIENYPHNFGWSLPKRGILLLTAHYTAIAADEESIVGVNLFFTDKPIERQIGIISIGSGGIGEGDIKPPLIILANQTDKFRLQVNTREDRSFMYVWPHMHLLGKEFTAYAVTPAHDTIHLVHIPAWDFRWQELYKFKKLIKIPGGSAIHLECTYDNTTNNPFNPYSPPKTIYSLGDMDSKNEMMTLLLIFTPYKPGDENISLE